MNVFSPPMLAELDTLLSRWEELRAQGIEISAGELAPNQPQLAAELGRRIAKLKSMDWLENSAASEIGGKDAGCCGATHDATIGNATPERHVPVQLGGRYSLESRIAEGGFGQVWRAMDIALARPVAVKLTTRPCIDEARRVAGLKHHGIVSVHDVGNQDGFCYIVFDLVEGVDLARRIQTDPPPWRESVKIVAQVADHLQYAHQKGFVHRDIKPANILLESDGTPVLADFGIAVTQAELEEELSTSVGTVAYMSPEQLRAEARLDLRVDIYGLGVVLFELLTGDTPFHGRSLWELREQILSSPPPRLQSYNPVLPDKLDEICQKCLRKSPDDRYASARELATELNAL